MYAAVPEKSTLAGKATKSEGLPSYLKPDTKITRCRRNTTQGELQMVESRRKTPINVQSFVKDIGQVAGISARKHASWTLY